MDKRLKIYFNDGNKIEFSYSGFHDQNNIGETISRLMNQSNIILEAEGRLYCIPTNSIKYLEINPAPKVLGNQIIRGARLLE